MRKPTPLSPKQIAALRSYERFGEPPDLSEYDTNSRLAWRNREQTIDSLKRRGLLDDEYRLTEAGRAALSKVPE